MCIYTNTRTHAYTVQDEREDADENVIVFILNQQDDSWPPNKMELAGGWVGGEVGFWQMWGKVASNFCLYGGT